MDKPTGNLQGLALSTIGEGGWSMMYIVEIRLPDRLVYMMKWHCSLGCSLWMTNPYHKVPMGLVQTWSQHIEYMVIFSIYSVPFTSVMQFKYTAQKQPIIDFKGSSIFILRPEVKTKDRQMCFCAQWRVSTHDWAIIPWLFNSIKVKR